MIKVRPLPLILITVICFAVAEVWFRPFFYSVWFGDDLSNWLAFRDGYFASNLYQALFGAAADKYRPIFQWAWFVQFSRFGDNIGAYFLINTALHAINAGIVFIAAFRLSRGATFVAALAALAFTVSRFALYQVTQVTGLLEGVALTFFLLAILALVEGALSGRVGRNLCLAALCTVACFHTHERYIVLVVGVGALAVLWRGLAMKDRAWPLIILAAGIIFNIVMKKIIIGAPFFVGTGGTLYTFNLLETLSHLKNAVASIFGFNMGPRYLTGAQVWELDGTPAQLFATMIVISAMFALWWVKKDRARLVVAVGIIFWAGLLLIPPIATIRFEQRWALAPFVVLLLVLAAGLGATRPPVRKFAVTIMAVCLCSSIFLDRIYAQHFDDIFFVHSAREADFAKRQLVAPATPPGQSLTLEGGPSLCQWVLLQGLFFQQYEGVKRQLTCVPTAEGTGLIYRYGQKVGFSVYTPRTRQPAKTGVVLSVTPSAMRVCDPPIVAQISWNASATDSRNVVINVLDGSDEKLFASGGSEGTAETGFWARAGATFILKDKESGEPLAEVTIRPDKC